MIIEEFINQGSKDETPIEGSEDFLSKDDIEKAEKEAEKRRMKEKLPVNKEVKTSMKGSRWFGVLLFLILIIVDHTKFQSV